MKTSFAIKISALAISLLGLTTFGVWLWSLGTMPINMPASIHLDNLHGSVQVKPHDQNTFQNANAGSELQAGDQIKTGTDGTASIVWGDRGITRLDTETTITIEKAPTDPNAVTNIAIQIYLQGGRTWSRFLKLLDIQSSAEVRTDTVVATVRGTAFGIAAPNSTTTEIAVTDSVVNLKGTDADVPVKEGYWGIFNASGTPNTLRPLTESDAWAKDNKQKDEDFDEALRRSTEKQLSQNHNKALEGLTRFSEKLHLLRESDTTKRDELATSYLLRRLDTALADQNTQPDITRSLAELSPAGRERALNHIRLVLFAASQDDSRTPNKDQRIVLEELRAALLPPSPTSDAFARALSFDDAIDAWRKKPEPNETERQHLLDELRAFSEKAPDDQRLKNKLEASRFRLDTTEIRVLPTEHTQPDMNTKPKKDSHIPILSKPKTDTPNESTTQPTTCYLQNLKLSATPSTIEIGSKATLHLFGENTCNGQIVDLTNTAFFSSETPNIGTLTGNIFTALHSGITSIVGSINDNGLTKSTKTQITVTTAVKKPVSINVTTPGTTTLLTGQTAPLEAQVTYNDGTASFVTYQCTWSTNDKTIAIIINGPKFQATNNPGTGYALCDYSENGYTVSGHLSFVVQLDPALQPQTAGGGTPSRTQPLKTY